MKQDKESLSEGWLEIIIFHARCLIRNVKFQGVKNLNVYGQKVKGLCLRSKVSKITRTFEAKNIY